MVESWERAGPVTPGLPARAYAAIRAGSQGEGEIATRRGHVLCVSWTLSLLNPEFATFAPEIETSFWPRYRTRSRPIRNSSRRS